MLDKILQVSSTVPSEWQFWPMGPGFGEKLLPSLAKLGFVALILGAIFIFLRLLFGPGGPLRDKEMDKQADEMREREMAELDARFERGEVSELEYKWEKKRIMS